MPQAPTSSDTAALHALLVRLVMVLEHVLESLPAALYPNTRREVEQAIRDAREVLE